MPAQLVALTGGPNILLDRPILLFGRHPECDIQLDSRKISRRHCCVAQVGDYLVVRDLDSTNGIRINGVRLREGRLREGDELTIGNFRYQLTWNALAARPAPAAEPADAVEEPRSTSHAPSDEILEACDEPIPLQEDERPAALPLHQAVPHKSPPGDDLGAARRTPKSPPSDPVSFALPDNIELAPASGEYPGKNPPPNGPPPVK